MKISTSERQREAAREAIVLLRNQAAGLAETGSKKTVDEMGRAIEALTKVASSESVDLAPEDKVRIERATFVLQGTRVGLDSADFHDRARIVQQTIDDLADFVGDYNAQWSDNLDE